MCIAVRLPRQEFEAAWERLQDELSQESSQRSILSKQLDVVKSKVGGGMLCREVGRTNKLWACS